MKTKQTKYTVLLLVVLSIIFISGCDQSPQEQLQDSVQKAMDTGITSSTDVSMMTSDSYTLTDVAMHNTKEDCWMVINNKVYDVTNYISSHPGGPAILEACGIDGTELFETRPMGSGTPHSDKARNKMDDYFIGNVIGE
jgi:cytochrome b involved in lipid metabolism